MRYDIFDEFSACRNEDCPSHFPGAHLLCTICEKKEITMDTCTQQPDCNCFDCFTNLDKEPTMNTCKHCTNPVPVPGTWCPTCNLLYRAYIASQASNYLTWEQYVEYTQEEAQEEADFHRTCSDPEAKWEVD